MLTLPDITLSQIPKPSSLKPVSIFTKFFQFLSATKLTTTWTTAKCLQVISTLLLPPYKEHQLLARTAERKAIARGFFDGKEGVLNDCC